VLLTRAPLYLPLRAFAFDLHVLGTPPALILSQDQTLKKSLIKIGLKPEIQSEFRHAQSIVKEHDLKSFRNIMEEPRSVKWPIQHFFGFSGGRPSASGKDLYRNENRPISIAPIHGIRCGL
jgi:hypothetical protein